MELYDFDSGWAMLRPTIIIGHSNTPYNDQVTDKLEASLKGKFTYNHGLYELFV